MPNGFTFDGKHSSQIGGVTVVTDYRFPLLPEIENKETSIDGFDGAIDGGKKLKPRIFKVNFILDGTSINDWFTKAFVIANWLNVSTVKPFIFDAIPDRQLYARPSKGVDPDRIGKWGRVEVEFIAFTPTFEAITGKTITATLNTSYPYVGTSKTMPVITVTVKNAASFFKLQQKDGNLFVLLNKAVAINDVIVIDMAARKVTQNGIDVRGSLDVTHRYFPIQGSTFGFTSNLTAPTISVVYKERWV